MALLQTRSTELAAAINQAIKDLKGAKPPNFCPGKPFKKEYGPGIKGTKQGGTGTFRVEVKRYDIVGVPEYEALISVTIATATNDYRGKYRGSDTLITKLAKEQLRKNRATIVAYSSAHRPSSEPYQWVITACWKHLD